MAILTRETTATGVTNKGSPLTNTELDNNFVELVQNKVDVSGAIIFAAKAGEALSKGDVVYVSGVSGNEPVVSKADADDASKMPAFGLAEADANNNAAVNVVTFGTLYDVNTSSFSAGDTVYVSTTAGAITATAPTGESSLLQNIGKVVRSHLTAGSIKVGGAGRTNATPNLNDGNVFIGNVSNQSAARALTTADIQSGTFADSRIAVSNVTQHQSALSITESQISDLDSYITASSINTLTNKSGNISQWTNDSGYITSYSETDTLADVTGRGATTTATITAQAFVGDGSSLTGLPAGYTNADVDTHLNTSTAASAEVLSWTGTDYDWVAQSGTDTLQDITDNGATTTAKITVGGLVSNGEVEEQTYALTGTAIDPANGTMQYKTLAANTTFTSSITEGEYVTLLIDDGSAYTITWPTGMYWPNGAAPTLSTTGWNVIQLWMTNSLLYGSFVSV